MIPREPGDGGATKVHQPDRADPPIDHEGVPNRNQHPASGNDRPREGDTAQAHHPSKTEQAVNDATEHKRQAKERIQKAAVAIVKVIVDELGVTAGLDCIVNGDASACGETAVNILIAFAGGLAEKLLAKYGLPWKWAKASRLAKKLRQL